MTIKFTGYPWQGDELVRPTDVAHYLNTSTQVLKSWRHRDYGPNYFWFGGPVLYSLDSVKNFAEKQITDRNMKPQNKSLDDLLDLLK